MKTRGKAAKRTEAIAGLLAGLTVENAAVKAGVSRRSLQRWLNDPDFLAEYGAAKRRRFDRVGNLLANTGPEAVKALRATMKSRKAREGAAPRVSAGRALLENLFRSEELQDFETRLERLESAITGIEDAP